MTTAFAAARPNYRREWRVRFPQVGHRVLVARGPVAWGGRVAGLVELPKDPWRHARLAAGRA